MIKNIKSLIALFLVSLLFSFGSYAADPVGYKYCLIAGYFREEISSENYLLYLSALHGAGVYGIDTVKWNDPICSGAFKIGKSTAGKVKDGKVLLVEETEISKQANQFQYDVYQAIVKNYNFK